MDDLRELLAEAVEAEDPRSRGPEVVRRRARQRRARKRLSAGVVAGVVAATGLWFAFQGFGGRSAPPTPAPAAPIDVTSLAYAWSVDLPGTGFPSMGDTSHPDRIFMPTTTGVVSYPKSCSSDPCAPLWSLKLSDEPSVSSAQIAVGHGVIAATLEGRLAVVASDCRSDGSACEPLWQLDAPDGSEGYAAPEIAEGVVKVMLRAGPHEQFMLSVVGFAIDCGSTGVGCDPLWTGDPGNTGVPSLGLSPLSPAVDGVFYQQVGTRVTGFAANCANGGATCQPDLVIDAPGDSRSTGNWFYQPALGHDELLFVSGTGSVYSYPEHCGMDCVPLWVGTVAEGANDSPIVAGDLFVVPGRSGLTAFPLACRTDGGECTPAWQASLGDHSIVAFADERSVVAVDLSRETTVSVVPTDCGSPCLPLWTLQEPEPIYSVVSDGRTLFLAVGHDVVGYPLDCQDPCDPVWQQRVAGEITFRILLDDSHLIVASLPDGAATPLTLTVFDTEG